MWSLVSRLKPTSTEPHPLWFMIQSRAKAAIIQNHDNSCSQTNVDVTWLHPQRPTNSAAGSGQQCLARCRSSDCPTAVFLKSRIMCTVKSSLSFTEANRQLQIMGEPLPHALYTFGVNERRRKPLRKQLTNSGKEYHTLESFTGPQSLFTWLWQKFFSQTLLDPSSRFGATNSLRVFPRSELLMPHFKWEM